MNVPFVDLRAQYLSLKEEMDRRIAEIINATAFIGGRAVSSFEEEYAAYIGAGECLAVANGTDAIEIALKAFGVGEGDEVIVPANTFIATAEPVTTVGARVVFADSEPDHYTIDVEDLRRKITPRTKAVIAVHLYGHPCDMDPIMEIAREHNLIVIEDASQSHGARYKGNMVGAYGHAATFSFYPGKNLGAYGDAGAIIFRDPDVARHARAYAGHGSLVKYHHIMEGRNSRLDGIQAAVLSVKLPHLDGWNAARRRNAELYDRLLAGIEGLVVPKVASYAEHVYHLYVVRVVDRDRLQAALGARGVSTGIHYPFSLPTTEAYSRFGHATDEFPVANGQMGELLSLPMYPELTGEMIRYTADAIREELSVTA